LSTSGRNRSRRPRKPAWASIQRARRAAVDICWRCRRPGAENWTLDGLVDVVNEAMSLAVRAVRPQDLTGLD
jgi:hypothetical protein